MIKLQVWTRRVFSGNSVTGAAEQLQNIRAVDQRGTGQNSRDILNNSHVMNMYNTFIQPYFNYCISLWGTSITSESDPLIKLQNRILRIMFSCKRSEDAWRHNENHKILSVKQFYLLEIAKLCFKHHTNTNPEILETAMPDKQQQPADVIQTRSTSSHNYVNNHNSNSSFKGSMAILEVFGCFKAQKCTTGVIISL
jgi:hypothetical protein